MTTDFTTITDNELIAEIQRRNLVGDILEGASDDEICRRVYNSGITAADIWDGGEDDDGSADMEDQFLDSMFESRFEEMACREDPYEG